MLVQIKLKCEDKMLDYKCTDYLQDSIHLWLYLAGGGICLYNIDNIELIKITSLK